jgi:hypothetical protein
MVDYRMISLPSQLLGLFGHLSFDNPVIWEKLYYLIIKNEPSHNLSDSYLVESLGEI